MHACAMITALAALASHAFAQGPTICDGNSAPDWDDCAVLEQQLQLHSTEYIPNGYPECARILPPDGVDPNSLNCRIAFCYFSADGLDTYSVAWTGYITVEADCAPNDAGGTRNEDHYYVDVGNNPTFDPEKKMKRSLAENQPDSARTHSREFTKRQAEGDSFVLTAQSTSVEKDGVQLTGRLPAGSDYTIEESDSQTVGIESSVEVGGSFFEILSASVSLSVSADYTTTNSKGLTVKVDCDAGQYGQVYWYPLYTKYEGFWDPSGANGEAWVPEDSSVSSSNFRIRCLT